MSVGLRAETGSHYISPHDHHHHHHHHHHHQLLHHHEHNDHHHLGGPQDRNRVTLHLSPILLMLIPIPPKIQFAPQKLYLWQQNFLKYWLFTIFDQNLLRKK